MMNRINTYRGPDGALVASHENTPDYADDEPTLAGKIEVVNRPDGYSVKIDGREFPWYMSEDGISTQVSSNSAPSVTLTILADSVSVVNDWSTPDG